MRLSFHSRPSLMSIRLRHLVTNHKMIALTVPARIRARVLRFEKHQSRWMCSAASYSPTAYAAVPSALEGLTAGFGMDPGVSPPLWPPGTSPRFPRVIRHLCDTRMAGAKKERLRPRQISTGRLKRLHVLHLRPIYPVVSRVPYPLDAVSDLILRPASRLDAFSGYPFRT